MTVPDQARGKKIRCKACDTVFPVDGGASKKAAVTPPPAARGKAAASAPRSRRPPRKEPEPERRSNLWLLPVLAGGGGLLLLGAIAAAAVVLLQNPESALTQRADANPPASQPKEKPNPSDKGGPSDPKPPPDVPKDKPPAMPWKAKADPAWFKFTGPFDTTTTLPIPFAAHPIFPLLPSPFVALPPTVKSPDEHVQVFDMRTMKPVGEVVKLRGRRRDMALSPDGKYMACYGKVDGAPAAEIYTTADGKLFNSFKLVVKGGDFRTIEFLGLNKLMVVQSGIGIAAGGPYVTTYDFETGKEVAHVATNIMMYLDWTGGGVSPGGKYLFLEETTNDTYSVHCWDLDTGEQVGQFEIQPKSEKWGIPHGYHFTPDGKLVSLLWVVNEGYWARIFTWDMATGKKIATLTIPNPLPKGVSSELGHGFDHDLQWLPDGSGWLTVGHVVLDRETGQEVGRVGGTVAQKTKIDALPTRRLLDMEHLAMVEVKGTKYFFRIEPVPKAEIEAAIKKARGDKKP